MEVEPLSALGKVRNLNDVFCPGEKDLSTTSTYLQWSNEILKSCDLRMKSFSETFSCVEKRKVVSVVGDPGGKFSRSIIHFQLSLLLHRFVNHPVDWIYTSLNSSYSFTKFLLSLTSMLCEPF